jgi:hypothetical protein
MPYLFTQKEPWFRAKKFGYGAGLPFKWQGWALLGIYTVALVAILALTQQEGAIAKIAGLLLVVVVTSVGLVIVRQRTEGGWKWRGDFGA